MLTRKYDNWVYRLNYWLLCWIWPRKRHIRALSLSLAICSYLFIHPLFRLLLQFITFYVFLHFSYTVAHITYSSCFMIDSPIRVYIWFRWYLCRRSHRYDSQVHFLLFFFIPFSSSSIFVEILLSFSLVFRDPKIKVR